MGVLAKPSNSNELKDIEQEIAEVEVLSEEETKSMENAFKNNMKGKASKIHGIFAKAQSSYDKILSSTLQSTDMEDDGGSSIKVDNDNDPEKQVSNLLNPLQAKVAKLKMESEMAQSKARSSEIQRYNQVTILPII